MSRAEQKLKTRARVVKAARLLYAKQGLADTRTIDIAREAGLSHGGIFVHFATRDQLLAEVVAQIGRDLTDRIHAQISQRSSFRQVLEVHLDCLAQHEPTYATFLRESRLMPADVLRTWIGIQSAISEHMSVIALREMKEGKLRSMEPHLLFNTWAGLVHHYLMNRELFSPGASVLASHGPNLVEHFLYLLTPASPGVQLPLLFDT